MRPKRYAVLRTCDPVADAERYASQEEPRPKCCRCGRELDGDYYFRDDEGFKCDDCVRQEYYMSRDDYLDLMEDYE